MSERKLSELGVATTLLAGDRLPILRRAVDEADATQRNQTVGLPALAGALSVLLQNGPATANVPPFDPAGLDAGGSYEPYPADFVVQYEVGGRVRQWAANTVLDPADFAGDIPAPTGDDATDPNWHEVNPIGPGFLPVQAVSWQLAKQLQQAGLLVQGRRYDLFDMVPGFVISVYAAGPESFEPDGHSLADADNAVLAGTVDVAAGTFVAGSGGLAPDANGNLLLGNDNEISDPDTSNVTLVGRENEANAGVNFGAFLGHNNVLSAGGELYGAGAENVVTGTRNTLWGSNGCTIGGIDNAVVNCRNCTIPASCERVTLINCLYFTVPAATVNKVYIDGVEAGAGGVSTFAALTDAPTDNTALAAALTAAKARANHTGTQVISTVTGLQTALDAKASQSDVTTNTTNIAANTAAIATKQAADVFGTLTHTAGVSIELNFTSTANKLTCTLAGNVTFAAAINKAQGRSRTLYVTNGTASTVSVTLPASWKVIGPGVVTLAAGKVAVFTVECATGSAETDVWFAAGAQL